MIQDILWSPSKAFIENSNLKNYEHWLAENYSLRFANYDKLWQWSIDELDLFWESLWKYFDIIHHKPYDEVRSGEMPNTRWFTGSTLNYAEHIFRMKSDDRPAIIFQNEEKRISISWSVLEEQVIAFQEFLIAQDIQAGDRIAAYLPNIPETIVCFLAASSLGIVWSCCSPDFGVETVIERFRQIKPKLIITADGYKYNNKAYKRVDEINQIRKEIPSIEHTIFIPYLDMGSTLSASILWRDIIEAKSNTTLSFKAMEFNEPIWVLYSSGTTGKPKAITHSHGGVLLEHLKYMSFHNDVKEGENFFWFTTTGWMMWNFLQASLLKGATIVLFDGSPAFPDLKQLWKMAAEIPVHHFGTSAPYLTACKQKELQLKDEFDLSYLRSIGSTGAPLPPSTFDWIYQSISSDVWLCSMSGGTDVCTAFVGGNPYAPVRRGNIQCRTLGTALMAYDETANHRIDILGEMVIEKAMPSMPIYFWNDDGNSRYQSSYFDHYPNKWRHGDWIKIFDDGSLIIQGRSDSTLNRKGIRIGTAEIYNVVNLIDGIKDSLVINIEGEDGEDLMPLFVVLEEDQKLDEALKKSITLTLKQKCSPRHVPDMIVKAPDIPYTLSGKKMEVPVKKIFMKMNKSGINREAIRNPKAIDFYLEYANSFGDYST